MEDPHSIASEIRALGHVRSASPGPYGVPMVFACAMTWPTHSGQYDAARRQADLPEQLLELWSVTEELVLFQDVIYGQSGLRLIGPQEAAVATTKLADRWNDDDRGPLTEALFVFGQFIGDGDLLAINRETGQVVYLPEILILDECMVVAPSLVQFLTAFRSFGGDRYWDFHENRRLMTALRATGPYGQDEAH